MLREWSDREPDPPREPVFGKRALTGALTGALVTLAVLWALIVWWAQ